MDFNSIAIASVILAGLFGLVVTMMQYSKLREETGGFRPVRAKTDPDEKRRLVACLRLQPFFAGLPTHARILFENLDASDLNYFLALPYKQAHDSFEQKLERLLRGQKTLVIGADDVRRMLSKPGEVTLSIEKAGHA